MSIYLGTPNLPPLQSIIDIIHACSEWPWLFYSPYSRIQGQSCISMMRYPFSCWILLPMAILAPYSYKYWLVNLILSNHFTLLNVSCWLIWVSYALVTRSLWSSVDVLVPPRWLYKLDFIPDLLGPLVQQVLVGQWWLWWEERKGGRGGEISLAWDWESGIELRYRES